MIGALLTGGSILSSLIGAFGGGDKGKEYTDKAIQELIKVSIPDPEQQKLALERYMIAGELDPKLESAIKSDPSAFEGIVQNQKYAQAQDRALNQLTSLGEEGGLSLTDKADMQEQMIENASKDRGNREAITDEMARRGQGGSGMNLQAQLQGAQAAGDRDAQMRLRAMGGAQDRALDAIMGAGELAGKLDATDYGRKSDLATARDSISRFNTENARGVQQRNVASQNAAAEANLNNKQNIMNANTDLSNKEQQYNKELSQRNYENQMDKAKSMANVYGSAAGQANQQSQQQKQAFGAIGSSLGQFGTNYDNKQAWDKWYEDSQKKKQGIG